MKKNLFLGMAALLGMSLAFTACSSDEDAVSSAANSKAIGFSVLTNNAAGTRATAITATNYTSKMENFEVWGYFSDTNASDLDGYYLGDPSLEGVVFENNGEGAFDYKNSSDLHYWPTDGKELNFFAFYPILSSNGAIHMGYFSGGYKDFNYTVPTNQDSQVDLMFAHSENDIVGSTDEGKASLSFQHKLSQVLFQAKSVSEAIEVEIKGITIHNVINNGSFDIDDSEGNIGEWELKTDENADSHYSTYSVGLASPAEVTYENSETKPVSATDENGVLMLLPQTLTAKAKGTAITEADKANQCYIEVEAKIKSIGYENGSKHNTTYLLGSESGYEKIYIPFSATWEEGMKYTYTLVFGGENGGGETVDGDPALTKIGFSVDVDDWTDYEWSEKDTPANGEINL